jgi:site-specific recombinase XerD
MTAQLIVKCEEHLAVVRAFALGMLRNGADVFALQKLMGHSDLQILTRYLAMNDADLQRVHAKASPINGIQNPMIY